MVTEVDLTNAEVQRIELPLKNMYHATGVVVENVYRRNSTTFDTVGWFMESDEKSHREIYVLEDEQKEELLMNLEI